MKVKVTLAGHQSGPIDGKVHQVGAVLNLPDDQARSLHEAGLVSIQKLTRIEQQRADELTQAAALEAETAKEAGADVAISVSASHSKDITADIIAENIASEVQTSAQTEKPATSAGKKK